MPEEFIARVAEEHGLSKSRVERYWRECKKSVREQEGELEGNYDQVRGCVINRAQKAGEGE